MKPKYFLLLILAVLSLSGAVYDWVLYWNGVTPSENLHFLWGLLFVIVIVLWVDADSKDYPKVYRPYDYGYLLYLFWLPYLPFYLWRTRGAVGMVMFVAFVGLFYLGYLGQWAIYAAR